MNTIVTLGEIMLRFKSPGHERFFQSPSLEATFGGGESNVASALSLLGKSTAFVTALPANPIGDGAVAALRSRGVETSRIIRQGDRLGTYYLETGANQRASNVVYDRAGSSICNASPEDFNWDLVFKDAHWFHITGITPAISKKGSELSLKAVQEESEGIYAIALPVFDSHSNVIAAVSIPFFGDFGLKKEKYMPLLKICTEEISRSMGYHKEF